MWDGFWKLTRYCSQMACVPSSFNNAHLTRTSCIRAENLLHDPRPLKLIRCYRCRVYASIGYVEIKGECSGVVWYEYAKGYKEEQSTHIFHASGPTVSSITGTGDFVRVHCRLSLTKGERLFLLCFSASGPTISRYKPTWTCIFYLHVNFVRQRWTKFHASVNLVLNPLEFLAQTDVCTCMSTLLFDRRKIFPMHPSLRSTICVSTFFNFISLLF